MSETAEKRTPATPFNGAEIAALSHLYRGELYRTWRSRRGARPHMPSCHTDALLELARGSS
jgi:hypothetical protein